MKCHVCKGTGKAYSYATGPIVCPKCGGLGRIKRGKQ